MNPDEYLFDRLNRAAFEEAFERHGFAVIKDVFDESFVDALVPELETAIEKEAALTGKGRDFREYGMLVACPVYGGRFLDVAGHREFMRPFDWLLGESCIIWVYTSSSMPPGTGNYSTRIHVDRPHFIPGYLEGMGSLILLSDLTEENGATWLMPGSHRLAEAPEEKEFYDRSVRLIAPKGSVFYFNLRLWHAGGRNDSDAWRHMLGIGMIRPYLKQRIDLPRALRNVDTSGLSDLALQKLGFHAQPPASIEQFYGIGVERSYTQRSEWEPGTPEKKTGQRAS